MDEKKLPSERPTDLLHLNNIVATSTYEEDEFFIVEARSKSSTFQKCNSSCEVVRFGTKKVRFRDFAIQARPTWLEISRQRYRCNVHDKIVYEDLIDLDDAARLTVRFRKHLENEAVQRSFADAARTNGVDESLVRRVFATYANERLSHYAVSLPRILGMDEKHIAKSARFVLTDIENGKLLDIRKDRLITSLDVYFSDMDGKDKVEVVCQDMYKGYLNLTRRHFPKAVTIVDKFHVLFLSTAALEKVRRGLNKDLTKYERISLKNKNKIFLARWDTCKQETRDQLGVLFKSYPILHDAYWVKERFFGVYDSSSRAVAEKSLSKWVATLPPHLATPFKPVTTAVKNWRPHILRYFEHRLTNAYTESANRLIAEINGLGRGYSFETLRAKALLKHGDVKPIP